MQMEMIKFCNVCHAIKCARVLKDHEYWTWTVNPVHKQWCNLPCDWVIFLGQKRIFWEYIHQRFTTCKIKRGKKTFYANLLGRSHIISSNKLELPSKMLAYETYLICICAMAHATECITRGQFDDIGIFFRFKFEEYIPLVMIFDKNIKETFSTT